LTELPVASVIAALEELLQRHNQDL
jgi:hypothetical protein